MRNGPGNGEPEFPGLPVEPTEAEHFKPTPPPRRRFATDVPNTGAMIFAVFAVGGILSFCIWTTVVSQNETAASRQIASRSQTDEFLNRMSVYGELVTGASHDGTFLRVTVSNVWFLLPKGIRFQRAQEMQEVWARISSPNRPDDARIKVVDVRGNELGGSRIAGGTLIWVDE